MMKLTEDVLDEQEALRSIYSADYIEREPEWSDLDSKAHIWGCPTFSIRIRPLAISVRRRVAEAQLRVEITLSSFIHF